MRTEKEIKKVIDDAIDNPDKFSGMSYTHGVANALEWVIENTGSSDPMED